MSKLDLTSLLVKLSVGAFLDQYWLKDALVVRSTERSRFRALLSLAAIEPLIAASSPSEAGSIGLVRQREGIAATSLRGTKDGRINLAAVRDAYQEGFSVFVSQLHRRVASVGVLCRSIECELLSLGVVLSDRVVAQAYLTPPDAQGFSIHYDDHEVLVLQVEGNKEWFLYDRDAILPVKPQLGPERDNRDHPLSLRTTLEPGDVIYIPRGLFHEARATESHSLHISLSIYPTTWLELTRLLLDQEPCFREALPVGLGKLSPDALNQALSSRLHSAIDPDLAVERLADQLTQFQDNLEPLPGDGFSQINLARTIGLDTIVVRSDANLPRIIVDDTVLRFVAAGAVFEADIDHLPAFEFILAQHRFAVGDLPELDSDSKIDIARRLVCDGVLSIVSD